MTVPRLTTFIIPALVLALSAGCSQQDATASQSGGKPDNVAMKTPPIYLRQTAVTIKNGHPYVETFYKQQLANCQKLQGSISMSPIATASPYV